MTPSELRALIAELRKVPSVLPPSLAGTYIQAADALAALLDRCERQEELLQQIKVGIHNSVIDPLHTNLTDFFPRIDATLEGK